MADRKEHMGKRIQEIRKKLDLSLEEFGKKLCLGKTAVHQYEQGITAPKLDTLVKLADLGKITLDELITGQKTKEDVLAKMSPEARAKTESVLNKRPSTRPINAELRLGWSHKITPPESGQISDSIDFSASEDSYDEFTGIIDQLQQERDELYYRVEDLLNQKVDFALIKQVIEAAMEHLQQNELEMAPDKFAELVEILYEEITETGTEEVNKGKVAKLIKLAI